MRLARILESDKTLRTVGVDDQSFERGSDGPVGVAGVVSKQTRFDGMVWDTIEPDGHDATRTLRDALQGGKFLPQLHALLLDGIALGGFNVVDLPALAEALEIPCVAVMRDRPDFDRIRAALTHVDDSDRRLETMRRAGEIHSARHVYFQVQGCSPQVAAEAVDTLTIHGHIPEPIRIAHLVATAVGRGESGRRA